MIKGTDRIIAIIACLAALIVVPEVRKFLKLPSTESGDGQHSVKSLTPSSVSQALTSENQNSNESQSSRIEAQHTDFLEERSASSAPSQTANEPQTLPGVQFQFQVLPKDARIYLDSEFIGTAEELFSGIRIPMGRHIVTITRPGYQPGEYKIFVTEGSGGLQANLSPHPGASQLEEVDLN